MDATLRRRLKLLEFPDAATLDLADHAACLRCVAWMEDRVVRHYKIEERGHLRGEGAGLDGFAKYLADLGCRGLPGPDADFRRCFLWLLGHAVSVVYEEKAHELNVLGTVCARECHESTARACAAFGLPPPRSAALQEVDTALQRVVAHVGRAGKGAAAAAPAGPGSSSRQAAPAGPAGAPHAAATSPAAGGDAAALAREVDQLPLPFVTGDAGVDRASRLLYVLYLDDLRGLQDQANACISLAQEFTANPKTTAAAT